MKRPTWLLLGLVWLAVVLVVSAVTWTVIDTAGREVLDSGQPVQLPGAGADTSSTTGPSVAQHPRRSHRPPGGRHTPPSATAASPQPSPSVNVSSTPPSTVAAGPHATPPPANTSSTPRPSARPKEPPRKVVRSWQGAAGTLTASCSGSRIALESASPNNGWRVEVGSRGPEHVDAEFKSGGDDGRETHVVAVCGGGVPRFSVQSDA